MSFRDLREKISVMRSLLSDAVRHLDAATPPTETVTPSSQHGSSVLSRTPAASQRQQGPSVLSGGRNFFCHPDTSLVIDGILDCYTLSTDPVQLSALQFNFKTELAWEMDLKTLQQHKLRHTPIKLQVFKVDNATYTRQHMGNVLLDIRTAKPLSKAIPGWCKVLNTCGQGSSPELFLSLFFEEKIKEKIFDLPKDVDGALVLHQSGEYYSYGLLSEQTQLFVISVTLDNPSGLPESVSPYYYHYNLVDVDITSEQFLIKEFINEKASIRILCSREQLKKLFSLKQHMKITLCQSDNFVGEGSLSLEPLLSYDLLECKVKINMDSGSTSCIDVTVHVQCDDRTSNRLENKDHTASMLSIKRNLTSSFEELSQSSVFGFPLSPAKRELCPDILLNSAEVEQSAPGTSKHCSNENLSAVKEVAQSSPHAGHHSVHECEAHSSLQSNTSDNAEELSKHILKSTGEVAPSLESPPHHVQVDFRTSSVPVMCVHVCTQTEFSSESEVPIPRGECEESGDTTHLYQFSIDIHSIHNITLEEELKCFIKYMYPFFGTRQSVIVGPSVSLVLGGEYHFSTSKSSFTFACSEVSLRNQLYCYPLSLELWTSRDQKDNLVGIAKVPLGEVLKTQKISFGNSINRMCSIKVPVMASLLSQSTCAYVHCTLTLEDQGPVPIKTELLPSQSHGLPTASEYLTAMELEMWKISQEETFTEQMKKKEASYLLQLQEEWKRREMERQRIFTKKVEAYNKLEAELQDTLDAAQCERRKLMSRETKLQQIYHKLSSQEQSTSKQCEAKVMQCQLLYEENLKVQRVRAEELLETVERLKSQVTELSTNLASKNAEFDEYRQQVLHKPESKLQAELTMVHLEKTELEKKLSTSLKAKKHYKDQWTQAMKELAKHRQNELKSARSILQKQQHELESVREGKVHSDEQILISEHLRQVKEEVNRLRKGKVDEDKEQCLATVTEAANTASPEVARWIEERDILLETGVYTNNDFTIQQLDKKIKAGK